MLASKLPSFGFQALRKWAATTPVTAATRALSTKASRLLRAVAIPWLAAAISSSRMAAIARPGLVAAKRWHSQQTSASSSRANRA